MWQHMLPRRLYVSLSVKDIFTHAVTTVWVAHRGHDNSDFQKKEFESWTRHFPTLREPVSDELGGSVESAAFLGAVDV